MSYTHGRPIERTQSAACACAAMLVALLGAACAPDSQKLVHDAAQQAAQQAIRALPAPGPGPETQLLTKCATITVSYDETNFSSTVNPKICYAYPNDTITFDTDDGTSDFDVRFNLNGLQSPFVSGDSKLKRINRSQIVRKIGTQSEIHRYVMGYKNTTADPHIIIMPPPSSISSAKQ